MDEQLSITIREAHQDDHQSLEEIRRDAFAPIFSSFRKLLGKEIYERAQKREDEEQVEILAAMFNDDSPWKLFVAEVAGEVVGFISIQLNTETLVGEIGLNAVKPSWSGNGIGTRLYEFAIGEMRDAGMKIVTVSTGGDDSHAPARRAYEKAGFDVVVPFVWMCQSI